MLGTLASRERRDPVVVVSGDRDLLQLVRDEPGAGPGALSGPRPGEGDEVRARRGRRDLRRARSTAPVRPTPNWRCCAAIRPTGCPGCPGVGEKTAATLLAQHGSLEGILAAAHDPKSKMSKAYRTKLLAATDYIEAAGPVVQGRDRRRRRTVSTPSDALPLAAEHPRKVAKLAEQYGVTSSIGRLQKALDDLPGR